MRSLAATRAVHTRASNCAPPPPLPRVQASPNLNTVVGQLPDLTPPRKHTNMQYSASYGSLNPSGASPQAAPFGFPRLPAR